MRPVSTPGEFDTPEGHVPIGELLLLKGAIVPSDLLDALAEQKASGELLGRVLVSMGACSRSDIGHALHRQGRVRAVRIDEIALDRDALALLTGEQCRSLRLIPFEVLPQFICVAMVNVLSRRAWMAVEASAERRARAFKASWDGIAAAIERAYGPGE